MSKELLLVVDAVANEKGVPHDVIFEAIEAALASAAKKRYHDEDVLVRVSIEDCETVSREVSAQLDVEDPISGNYTLEVSSPGVDRPLFTPAQFGRFVGESAKVGLKLPQDGRRRLQGVIVAFRDDTVVLDVDGTQVEVSADNIDKARLVPDWAALGLAPTKPGKGKAGDGGKKTPARGARGNKTDGASGDASNDIHHHKPAADKPTPAE